MSDIRNTEEFRRGQRGEIVVATALKRAGYRIVMAADYSGPNGNHAPRLEGIEGFAAILADLDVIGRGRRWVEVKTKDGPVKWGGWHGAEIHGYDLPHRDHYLQLQAETATAVWIFVYEEQSGEILSCPLDRTLLPGNWNIGAPSHKFPRGSFNWRRSIMNTFAVVRRGEPIHIVDPDWPAAGTPVAGRAEEPASSRICELCRQPVFEDDECIIYYDQMLLLPRRQHIRCAVLKQNREDAAQPRLHASRPIQQIGSGVYGGFWELTEAYR